MLSEQRRGIPEGDTRMVAGIVWIASRSSAAANVNAVGRHTAGSLHSLILVIVGIDHTYYVLGVTEVE